MDGPPNGGPDLAEGGPVDWGGPGILSKSILIFKSNLIFLSILLKSLLKIRD